MATDGSPASVPGVWRRIGWFIGLWAAGAALAIGISYGARALLG
jgi:hypothetical protein